MRKTNLVRLLARRPEGIFVSELERGEIGPDLFRAACRMGLEGMVSKRRDRPYRAGRSPHWIKMKNRKHPAVERVKEAFAQESARKIQGDRDDNSCKPACAKTGSIRTTAGRSRSERTRGN
jgi:bifunctional non-homologous end joining protein LigD